jgi:hypothetical protein
LGIIEGITLGRNKREKEGEWLYVGLYFCKNWGKSLMYLHKT